MGAPFRGGHLKNWLCETGSVLRPPEAGLETRTTTAAEVVQTPPKDQLTETKLTGDLRNANYMATQLKRDVNCANCA